MSTLKQQVVDLITPLLTHLGCALWGVELFQRGRSTVLLVYIDKPEGVSADDCAKASRQIGSVLDVHALFSGRYVLEVSSPGMDRYLYTPEQYAGYVQQRIQVTLKVARGERKRFSGVLVAVDEAGFRLETEEETLTFSWAEVAKAQLCIVDN